MIKRKKKLRFIQLVLFFFGITILYLTYYVPNQVTNSEILKQKSKKERSKILEGQNDQGDVFLNVEYAGLDLNGNRYLLKSKEAYLDKENPEIVYMRVVESIFYFKDNTNLYVWADEAIYNNKTLDMKFRINVKANYLNSKLFAEKVDYSNTDSFLSIYENVKINDIKGNLIADKLVFDITEQNLNITSFNDGKVKANIKLDEKRF